MANKIIPYNPELRLLARKLRNNSTLNEVLLWSRIKNKALGFEFHRQVPMDNYIVDFFCHELMLCIEIDGNSHELEAVFKNDIERQGKLEGFGVRFIRFNDLDVKKDIENVIRALVDVVAEMKERNLYLAQST